MKSPEDYQIRHNSSVDRIERAVRFMRCAYDFEELLDLDDDDRAIGEFLAQLINKAKAIIHDESGD